MTCTIDHGAPGAIPRSLCRNGCNPPLPSEAPAAAPAAAPAVDVERYTRRKLRRLRAERKRLREQRDLIAGRDAKATAKLDAAIAEVQREININS